MIYQLKVYYGALLKKGLKGRPVYSMELEFDDCTKPFQADIDEKPYKKELIKMIKADSFNPSDFEFRWLTKEEYENKVDSNIVKSIGVRL